MNSWMTIRSAARRLKQESPDTMIGESTIRFLVANGFPCVHIGSRTLINADTFYENLAQYTETKQAARQHEHIAWTSRKESA